ncbi:hypothetical protein Barb4_00750 [Bacteroidales bacterium Barb4]|nr:hypothetical protein Barb4_00750 [Bacteroidales bacterium Barb4]
MHYFRGMKKGCSLLILCMILCGFQGKAQGIKTQGIKANTLPEGYQRAVVDGKDTMIVVRLREIVVYPEYKFKNKRERQKYDKLVRDVKRTLPYAKMVYSVLIETYEYMETLPNEKARQVHLKRMEKELYSQYMPELKRLTLTQGKLLIKLINRECNQSSYNLLKAYLGSFRATFWNLFANMFGAGLKSEYDPKGKDAMTERVVVMVESGVI